MTDFLESLRQGLEKGIGTVTARSRELLEASTLRVQIRELEDRRRHALEELGNIVHLMLRRGALDESRLREKSAAVLALDEAIAQRQAQIEEIQRATAPGSGGRVVGRCACGAELVAGTKFGGGCGHRLGRRPRHRPPNVRAHPRVPRHPVLLLRPTRDGGHRSACRRHRRLLWPRRRKSLRFRGSPAFRLSDCWLSRLNGPTFESPRIPRPGFSRC